MDEKKNVGFIPGLALILSALALVLISINAVKPTPSEEALEKSMNKKIEALYNSEALRVKNAEIVSHQLTRKLFERDLVNLDYSLEKISGFANPDMAQDLDALKAALANVKQRLYAAKQQPAQ